MSDIDEVHGAAEQREEELGRERARIEAAEQRTADVDNELEAMADRRMEERQRAEQAEAQRDALAETMREYAKGGYDWDCGAAARSVLAALEDNNPSREATP